MKKLSINILILIAAIGCTGKVASLVSASSDGNIAEVRRLLDAGVDPCSIQRNNGWTPLHIAAAGNHPEIVEMLINAGAPVNSAASVNGMEGASPIFFALMYGHTNVINVLVTKGADLKQTFRGQSIVEFAQYCEQQELATYLQKLVEQKGTNPEPDQ